jgi:type IV pilus assembly protein PilF
MRRNLLILVLGGVGLAAGGAWLAQRQHGLGVLERKALVAIDEGRCADAAELERQLEGASPGSVESLRVRAALEHAHGSALAARSAYEALLTASPEDSQGWLRLGRMQAVTGRRAEARRSLERSVRIDPRSTEARLTLAQVCGLLGDEVAARSELEAALTLAPPKDRSTLVRQVVDPIARAGKTELASRLQATGGAL